MKHKTFFDEENRLDKLTKQGDPLVKLKNKVDWEVFRGILSDTFKKKPLAPGGRSRYDYVLMFKILIRQRYYNLSDEQMEFEILNCLNFNRFLGLGLQDLVPDRTTIWNFREHLIKQGEIKQLFNRFKQELKEKKLLVKEGTTIAVDATFIDVPRQRNTKEENELIKKEGKVDWKKNPHKLAQKDTEARWTTKGKETHYGYKNHIKIENKNKFIETYDSSEASLHDSKKLGNLLSKEEDKKRDIYGDAAYVGEEIEKLLEELEMVNKIHERGYREHPLTDEQKDKNKKKSKIRARVEHVFGFMTNSMRGCFIRSIGMRRADGNIGLMNLTYNIFRSLQVQRA